MPQNGLRLSIGNSVVQQSKVQFQTFFLVQNIHILFSGKKNYSLIPLSENMVVNRSLLFELELNEYLDITTSKAQIISAFVTSCLLVHTLIAVFFKYNASLESPAPLLNKVEALDEGSVRLSNEVGVSFGNLSSCLVLSA